MLQYIRLATSLGPSTSPYYTLKALRSKYRCNLSMLDRCKSRKIEHHKVHAWINVWFSVDTLVPTPPSTQTWQCNLITVRLTVSLNFIYKYISKLISIGRYQYVGYMLVNAPLYGFTFTLWVDASYTRPKQRTLGWLIHYLPMISTAGPTIVVKK